jgi:hypothetical protein
MNNNTYDKLIAIRDKYKNDKSINDKLKDNTNNTIFTNYELKGEQNMLYEENKSLDNINIIHISEHEFNTYIKFEDVDKVKNIPNEAELGYINLNDILHSMEN